MSTYHLHARLFEGTLDSPLRNELQTGESDDYSELAELAYDLLERGFTVWAYEHGPRRLANGEGAYRLVREWRPPTGGD